MSSRFDFGRNWEDFSAARLDAQRLDTAAQSLQDLIGPESIAGRTFLDIGCGSGLFSIAASQCGAARTTGFDVNPTAIDVSRDNAARFAGHGDTSASPEFLVGDVLDRAFLAELGTFDTVYAWGSLHHTGSLWQAVRNTASLVDPEKGILTVAIYNQHWTSPIWKQIKRLYNLSPGPLRMLLNCIFAVVIYIGVWLTARENPLHKERGMDFWYDVVDWMGGYPYECASISDVVSFVGALGFEVERIVRPRTGTGCNEFVFRHSNGSARKGSAASMEVR